jgi:hypothetical protein
MTLEKARKLKKKILAEVRPTTGLDFAIKNTSKPNDLVMVREYALGSGAYVRTNLVVRGPNGKVARIYDLDPAAIGQLTRAGVKKL